MQAPHLNDTLPRRPVPLHSNVQRERVRGADSGDIELGRGDGVLRVATRGEDEEVERINTHSTQTHVHILQTSNRSQTGTEE